MGHKVVEKAITKVVLESEYLEEEFVINMPLERFVQKVFGITLDDEQIEKGVDITLLSETLKEYEEEKIIGDDD